MTENLYLSSQTTHDNSEPTRILIPLRKASIKHFTAYNSRQISKMGVSKLAISVPKDETGKSWPAIAVGVFVAFGGVLFGYDLNHLETMACSLTEVQIRHRYH